VNRVIYLSICSGIIAAILIMVAFASAYFVDKNEGRNLGRGISNATPWNSVRTAATALRFNPEEPDCEISDVGYLGRRNRPSDNRTDQVVSALGRRWVGCIHNR
jgi:hypothetical protein